jgi:hypothetical protein
MSSITDEPPPPRGDRAAALRECPWYARLVGHCNRQRPYGDGSSPTTGTVLRQGDGVFVVNGTRTYSSTGKFKVKVTVTEDNGGPLTIHSLARVVVPH